MKKMTPEQEAAQIEDRLKSLSRMVKDLRHQIEILKDEAETGGEMDSATAVKALNELNKVVVTCTNMENRLDECRNRQAGIARGGHAINMDKVRSEIGRKLDKLRRCRGPEPVSE